MSRRSVEDVRTTVTERIAGFDRREVSDGSLTRAAVALAVVEGTEGPAVLLTVRAGHLRAHGGQFALPGGRTEPGESPTTAALRELEEELGLAVGADAVLGLLDDYPTRSGYRVTPVVVWAGQAGHLSPDPSEVAAVHEVTFGELDRSRAPRFLPTADPSRPLIEYPLLGTLIYAPTAAILYQFREVALRGETTRVDHLEQPLFAWR